MVEPHSAPTVVDLFCGAGGLSLGFRAAGCTIVAGFDNDPRAVASFRNNISRLQPESPPVVSPVTDLADAGFLETWEGAPPDILVGGPPCQGFSRIGRAKLRSLHKGSLEEDPRNRLYHAFLEVVRAWRPKAVLMENVPGMMNVGGKNIADLAAADLSDCGYLVGYAILNAVWYGVPQFRERIFFVGLREDLDVSPALPEATHRANLPAGYLRRRSGGGLHLPFVRHHQLPVSLRVASRDAVSVSDALDDLPPRQDHLTPGRAREDLSRVWPYREEARSDFARLMRNWPGFPPCEVVGQHVIRRTPRDYETFRRMDPGHTYVEALQIAGQIAAEARLAYVAADPAPPGTDRMARGVREYVPPYSAEHFRQKWRKLIPDRPSWTIPAHLQKDSYSHIHHDSAQARMISVREAARLQSFPDAFTFEGNMGDAFRQIGNAVPPLLSWALAASILTRLGHGSKHPWRGR